MTRRVLGCAAVALLTLSCFSDRSTVLAPLPDGGECVIPGSAIGPDRVVVLVRGFAFLQDTMRVRPGTTVTWINCEPRSVEPHTVTSTADLWDSGSVASGEAFARTFTAGGSYDYFCRPHPFMRGTVIVE